MKNTWHAQDFNQVIAQLNSSDKGLSVQEATSRLSEYGENKLPSKKPAHWAGILFSQFKSPLIYILVIAATIELFISKFFDAGVIYAAVLVNVVIGFIQEFKAENAIHQLRSYISFSAKVFRDGQINSIPSSELVPGDVVIIEAGDRVPADGRLISLRDLQVNEAALTGESMPVHKDMVPVNAETSIGDQRCMVFMGTTVSNGRGEFIVTGTGISTQIGEVAKLLTETKEEETPLQQKIKYLGVIMSYVVLGIVILIIIQGQIRGFGLLEMFETAVAVAVAAIPEGLVISVTVILTLGMQRILRQKALVRTLLAAETLGSTSIICSDKTGTLTEGVMKVTKFALSGEPIKDFNNLDKSEGLEEMLRLAVLCNEAFVKKDESGKKKFLGDTTESALLFAADAINLDIESVRKGSERIDIIPFNSDNKFMATLHRGEPDSHLAAVKGAPDQLLKKCSFYLKNGEPVKLNAVSKKLIQTELDELSSQGLRVLGVAYKRVAVGVKRLDEKDIKELVFVGLLGMHDPLRAESKTMLNLTRQAGIRTIIVTGDHKLTATKIAKDLGYEIKTNNVIEGVEMDSWSDAELRSKISEIDVFARVSPRHKIRIVDAWRQQGEVVAMLGDGVNDAPALKAADIGVVVGSGTDVAKQTADLVLLDDNFKSIVMAIRQGRMILDNIRKVLVYVFSASFSEVVLISGALLIAVPLPLNALQILYINMVTDTLPNMALAFEPGEKDVMSRPPVKRSEKLFTKDMKILVFLIGLTTDCILFAIFFYLYTQGLAIEYIRTVIFITLGFGSLLYVLSCKDLNRSIFKIPIFSNKYLLAAIGVGVLVQLAPVFISGLGRAMEVVPLRTSDWILIICAASVKLIAIEIGKFIINYKRRYVLTLEKGNS